MEPLALISAIVGAVASGFVAYRIRLTLDQRAIDRTERHAAYVHLVHITGVVATGRIFGRHFVDTLAQHTDFALPPLSEDQQDTLLIICADVLEWLKLAENGDEDARQQRGQFKDFLKIMADKILRTPLTMDQSSKLPKATVRSFASFVGVRNFVFARLNTFINLLESGSAANLSIVQIAGDVRTLQKYYRSAEELRQSLVTASFTSRVEADALLASACEAISAGMKSDESLAMLVTKLKLQG